MTQSLSQPKEDTSSPQPSESKRKPPLRLLIPMGLLVIGAAGFVTWYFTSRPQTDPLELSGRIEGYETDVGAKVAGRVNFVAVREGDQVKQGQVIVRLDDDEIQAQLQGAIARVTAAQQQQRQAQLQLDVVNSQIQEAQLNLQQSQGDTQGRIYQAQSNVAAAEAQLNQAEAQLNQAKSELKLATVDRDRFAQLVQDGAVPRQQFDQAQANFETAQATVRSREAVVEASRKQVSAAQGGLVQAQTTSLNPDIRTAQLSGFRKQLAQAQAQLDAAQAEVKSAQAARQQISAQIAYLNVVSPIDGVVTARSVEPGTVVSSGKSLLTLINLNSVYMRGYIPEGNLGKVRVGQQARVFLDSAPDQALGAQVAAVDSQASFTPENVYFRDDRVKQVFGIRLSINNPGGFAKPGMPADAEIVTETSHREARR